MDKYKILISKGSYEKAISFLEELKTGHSTGKYLQEKLNHIDLFQITPVEFIELIIGTKKPQIFAESAVFGNGSDWEQIELSILGDISITASVTVFDNGRHIGPEVHETPFSATLLFTPGALLRNDRNLIPADWKELTRDGEIHSEAYCQLYERRLLPSLLYANEQVNTRDSMVLITIPGLGCGQFAGKFRGQLGVEFKNALKTILENHGSSLSNIKVVYFDPYRECENERHEINGISFLVRPLTKGNENKPQLCKPTDYQEEGNEFADCELFSFVAWDHVSWPGNDFYAGSRVTDDGVKAAATDVMMVMTGIEGKYDASTNKYNPPAEYDNWGEVIRKNKVQIKVKDNLIISSLPG